MVTPEQEAAVIIYLAISDEVKFSTGRYFDNRKSKEPSSKCKDLNMRKSLWHLSEKLTGLA